MSERKSPSLCAFQKDMDIMTERQLPDVTCGKVNIIFLIRHLERGAGGGKEGVLSLVLLTFMNNLTWHAWPGSRHIIS